MSLPHGEARKKICSARLALQPCGSSTATRVGRRGQASVAPTPRGRHFSRAPDLLTPPCGVSATAARQEPAPLEKPQGRRAGPALPRGRKSRSLGPRCPKGLSHFVAPTFRSAPEWRLRLCDPEVATVNSSLELTVGSSPKEKPTVPRALTVATRCKASLYTLRILV